MFNIFSENAWVFETRGYFAILFGIFMLVWTPTTIAVLISFFGAYVLLDGVIVAVLALRMFGKKDWWMLLLEGIAGITLGTVTFAWPWLATLIFLYGIAAWAMITGIIEIAIAFELKRVLHKDPLLAMGGAVSFLAGMFVMIFPEAGAIALIWLLGLFLIAIGILLLVLSFRLSRQPSFAF